MTTRVLALLLVFAAAQISCAAETQLQNDRYRLVLESDGAVSIGVSGMAVQRLRPEFTVLSSAKDPKLTRIFTHPNYAASPRNALRWDNRAESLDSINKWLGSPAFQAATGLRGLVTEQNPGERTWAFHDGGGRVTMRIAGARALETTRPFSVGQVTVVLADQAAQQGNTIRWRFPAREDFDFSAELVLPHGDADPEIHWTITPKQSGFYSVAFTGAPANELKKTLPIPQETDARGHKLFNFVMAEPDLHLPRAQVATQEGSTALVVGPDECRFRLPTLADSRFGLMLEEKDGLLKPVLFAPLFGGTESRMKAGKPWSFTFSFVQRAGDWKETYSHIARDIHGMRDQRDNSGPGPLNGTIARVVDFLTGRRGGNHAMWDDQQKYYDYFTDKTGIFKPFSPLYGLSAAIVTDDESLFRERALPAVEFAISRRSSVFAPYDNSDNKQANSAVRIVGAPYTGYAQLLSIYEIFQRRTPGFLNLAERRGMEKNSVSEFLARWRLSGDAKDLDAARMLANKLSGRTEEALFDLLNLADATKDPAALDAAVEAAYANAALRLNSYPVPPDTKVTVDQGGQAPVHLHSVGRHANIWGYPRPEPVRVPEQSVPAWRVARLGVPSPAYPMEYWMNSHGATLRIAGLAQDSFLRAIAHWGVVGRFGNYPGDNRSKESLIPESPDAVEAPPWKWNFATVNPGHAWDFVAQMIDFLVSDAFDRSHGAIDFPALSAAGSAFRVRVYGSAPGKFYDDQGVYLWLPKDLVETDNPQIDWLAGHGNGNLYLALWNQSFREETVTVRIDPARAECGSGDTRVWLNNSPSGPVAVKDQRFTIIIPPKGIAALAIPAKTKPGLQSRLYDPATPALGENSFSTTAAPFGPVHAMLIRSGRYLNSAFVYTEALPENVISARLRWKQGQGDWHEMTDDIYPYEFSPQLEDGDFFCVLEVEDASRKVLSSPVIPLSPSGSRPSPAATPPEKPFAPLQPVQPWTIKAEPPLDESFVSYIKAAANPDGYGLKDGKYFPYSTPQGRRIAWRQQVWDKALYSKGCTPEEAEQHLRGDLARTQNEIKELLAARNPAIDISALSQRQKETVLDMGFTEGTTKLSKSFVDTVLAGDWSKLDHMYVRYAGHAPDHVRNKAFASRWDIK